MNSKPRREVICGIYNRVSTEEETQKNALQNQIVESDDYAARKGWRVYDHFVELKSGTNVERRSEYQRLCKCIEDGTINLVLVKSQDRLMRDNIAWFTFEQLLERTGCRLVFYIEDREYNSESDSFLTGIQSMLNAQFSANLSKKISQAHRTRQKYKTGLNITKPMFGWNKIGTKKDAYFVINEVEAGYIRYACELVREGYGFHRIANEMYGLGARSSRGGRIDQVTWRKMLLSTRMYGTVILNQYQTTYKMKGRRVRMPEEEWVYIPNAIPAIMTKEEHEEIVGIIGSKTKEYHTSGKHKMVYKGVYGLSNKVICGKCGSPYYRFAYGKCNEDRTRGFWKCSNAFMKGRERSCNSINLDDAELLKSIEKSFYEICKGKWVVNMDLVISQALQMLEKVFSAGGDPLRKESLENDLSRQKKRLETLWDKLTDEVIGDNDFKMQKAKIEEKIQGITAELEKINRQEQDCNGKAERLETIRERLRNSDIIPLANSNVISKMVERVEVKTPDDGQRTELEIYWSKEAVLKYMGADELSEFFPDDGHMFKSSIEYISVCEHKKAEHDKDWEEFKKELLGVIQSHPQIMQAELMELLQCKEWKVSRGIHELKAENRLVVKRLGNEHRVRYTVLEAD